MQRGQPANGLLKQHSQQAVIGLHPGLTSPVDDSTMAIDLAPAGDQPQPSASGQPSSLPPPGDVAAAIAALEQAQSAQNGGLFSTPPPAAAELGELYAVLQQQNGYATHANSAIGNGNLARSSPERGELTSPSRVLTHDSTGSGSHQRSKQTAKRQRTSNGPAGSSQRAGS